MKKKIALIAAAMALTATSAMAGLTLKGDSALYTNKTVQVSCNGVAKMASIVNQDVPWLMVNMAFLSMKGSGHCTFYYKPTGAVMGEGDVAVSGSTGKISNVKAGNGYNISVTPDQQNYYGDVTISIS